MYIFRLFVGAKRTEIVRIVRLVLKSDSCHESNDTIGKNISIGRFCFHLDMVSTIITPLHFSTKYSVFLHSC